MNDARSALLLTRENFDAIVSQPSHPWTAAASHLYTKEFFDLARDPGETRNLAGQAQYAEVLAEHRQWLKTWNHGLEVAPTVPKEYHWG